MKIYKFITDWILIFAIIGGILGYFAMRALPLSIPVKAGILQAVEVIQPLFIFAMLFLTFCKTDLSKLRLSRYHWLLLLVQVSAYLVIGSIVMLLPRDGTRIVLEGAMICFICPTATAGAVIVKKLGGEPAHISTYTILINLAAALLIPATLPLVHPNPDMSMIDAGFLILGKVFPLLLFPLLAAWLLKKLWPHLHEAVQRYGYLSFDLWVVSLTLALAVTTRYFVHSSVTAFVVFWLVVVSLLSCVLQFWIGRRIGARYGDEMTAGQSLGQKNTVFAIWLGYTFFTPVTSVVGGFYSIWHNIINSWQLYKAKHDSPSKDSDSATNQDFSR